MFVNPPAFHTRYVFAVIGFRGFEQTLKLLTAHVLTEPVT